MEIREHYKAIFITCAVFCLIYTIFAVKPLSTELCFKPEWTINVIKAEQIPEGSTLIPFKLGQSLGYFTDEGRIGTLVNFGVKGTITNNFYTCYGYDSSSFDIYDKTGARLNTIKRTGYPFFTDDRVYVFMPGGCSVLECTGAGEEVWRYEGYSPITAFGTSPAGSIVGFADGNIFTFDKEGQNDCSYSPGGSHYPVILGAGISQDGQYTASVSGHERQRFVLSRKSGMVNRTIFHEYLPGDQTQQVLVKFSLDDKYVFYNYKGGLGIHSIAQGKTGHIAMPGIVLDIKESSVSGLVFVLCKDKDTYTVYAIEPLTSKAGEFSFKAKNSFIETRGYSLFVGRDNQISKLSVTRN